MADVIKLKEVMGPLWKKLETYYKYDFENYLIDNEESDISILFQKEGENTSILTKPSLALFHGDPILYEEQCRKLRKQRYDELLQTTLFRRNQKNFEELSKAVKVNKITPFVGAGASIAAGCSSWPGYLESRAREVGIQQNIIDQRLENREYEDLLQEITGSEEGLRTFEFYFEQDFEHAAPELSFAWDLPTFFQSCVITTNFDRVLEDCYSRQEKSFTEKTAGLNNPHSFIKAITKGQRYLLKLHGNMDDPDYRVFTQQEYQSAYSKDPDKNVDLSAPLPKLLEQLYMNHAFLFLGCSLYSDRTVKTFELLCEQNDRKKIADHFAILERPENDEESRRQEQRLMSCNIKPIWYEFGQHEKVGEILNLLQVG